MLKPIRVPFRFKILVSMLLVVTAVVSLITFTMARMFHEDKAAYVADLASLIATNAAEEAAIVLHSARQRLVEVPLRLGDSGAARDYLVARLQAEFEGMSGFLAVRLVEDGAEVATVVDSSALDQAGVTRAAFLAALADEQRACADLAPGHSRVVNSTCSPRLLSLTMSVAVRRPGARRPLLLIGVIDQRRMLGRSYGSGAFEVFLADARGNVLNHGDANLVASHRRFDWLPVLPAGSVAIVKGYSRHGVDMLGGFARVEFGDLIVGAQIPRSVAFFATRRLLRDLVLVALALLLTTAVVSLLWSGTMTSSLVKLAKAVEAVGRGEFKARVEAHGDDEMGQLAGSFNHMSEELQQREEALRRAQIALIQSEKMAAFGQLGAGIAHEIKNPLAGILGIVQLANRTTRTDDPLRETLAIVEKETKRCRDIVDNLLKFARQGKLDAEPFELAAVVQNTAAIMSHQMSLHKVELRTQVEDGLPAIHGNANQIQQVLMNLLLNAEQAIEDLGRPGVVELSAARAAADRVELRVRDNGPGIPPHIVGRIFEPFFTTKPTGKGTGLGLSVTFGIVGDHGGTIRVDSVEGEGTTFVIVLPVPSVKSLDTTGKASTEERKAA